MDLVDRLAATAFLGREFLTWLWYRSDLQEGLFQIGDGVTIEVFLTDRISLAGAGQGADKVSVKAEDPTLTAEAHVALEQAKKVEKACVRITSGQREWTTTIAGDSLALSGIKIPALLTREEDEKLSERLALIDELDTMVTALFRSFVDIRLDAEAWMAECSAMQSWVMTPKVAAPAETEPG
jgi:hypothetical protein